ncbi:hypothetical protein Pst134EA_019354 [Puccinia striiformis f. sp. tritici]|uniref:hypothetical protein n=1 Tax=Puccinia striiformis f. sp. tritici TaxID=168172 RepID=UPI002008BDF3|nr:hypothetical protein Pst134EA_019354 [Puccinia striiformis f. sp. tritici]KAH9459205.1 hypothetical protein Pst134EA_019354 [Puccinia striiformis f. sp. tritici]
MEHFKDESDALSLSWELESNPNSVRSEVQLGSDHTSSSFQSLDFMPGSFHTASSGFTTSSFHPHVSSIPLSPSAVDLSARSDHSITPVPSSHLRSSTARPESGHSFDLHHPTFIPGSAASTYSASQNFLRDWSPPQTPSALPESSIFQQAASPASDPSDVTVHRHPPQRLSVLRQGGTASVLDLASLRSVRKNSADTNVAPSSSQSRQYPGPDSLATPGNGILFDRGTALQLGHSADASTRLASVDTMSQADMVPSRNQQHIQPRLPPSLVSNQAIESVELRTINLESDVDGKKMDTRPPVAMHAMRSANGTQKRQPRRSKSQSGDFLGFWALGTGSQETTTFPQSPADTCGTNHPIPPLLTRVRLRSFSGPIKNDPALSSTPTASMYERYMLVQAYGVVLREDRDGLDKDRLLTFQPKRIFKFSPASPTPGLDSEVPLGKR